MQYRALGKIVWGYVFILVNINILVDLLPNFVGFILFYGALMLMQEEDPSLQKLIPFCVILGLYHGVCWILPVDQLNWLALDLLVGVLYLYFNFCLLNGVASLASRAGYDDKAKTFRTLRNVDLIFRTAYLIFFSFFLQEEWNFALALFSLILNIVILVQLILLRYDFDYQKPAEEE